LNARWVFLLCLLSVTGSFAQTITISKDNRTIAVTATDDAQVVADVAIVSVGFTAYGVDSGQLYADATKTSNAIISALHTSGVKTDAIESATQLLTELDADSDKVRFSKGLRFRFSQSWHVTVPAQAAAGILHTAITAGANDSGGIQWKLSNEEAAEAAAADKALAHARKIAEQYVAKMKNDLGPLVYISNQVPSPNLFKDRLYAESAITSASTVDLKPLAIEPEKITKSATVYAVFAIY
jgi:uncharacterized protein YggE